MAIPIKYNLRNLRVRWATTLLTASSILLTVLVFVALMALATGLQKSLSTTGQPLNLIIMREGSQSEGTSSVARDSLQVIKYLEGIAKDEKGEPWVSPELLVLINLARRGQTQGSNVTIRGLGPNSASLRPQFKLLAGRYFRSGLREVIVSRRIAERFQDCALGDRLKFAKGYWTVVGVFDAGGTAYDSEIWADVNDLATDFDRDAYSTVMVRATDAGEKRLLILLQIALVTRWQPLAGGEERKKRPVNAARFPANQFPGVRILLLRHQAAAGGVFLGQVEKTKLGRREEDHVLRKTREMHGERRQRE